MLAPGVRQAYIDLVPALKGDRRVKKHKLAVFRLQQYNRILQVCLCPTAIFLLALFYLIAEKVKLYNEQQTACSQFIICSDCRRDVGRESTPKTNSRSLVCTSSLSFRFKTLKHRKKIASRESTSRVVMGIQLLLLKAGDVEPNPGPMRLDILINELITIAHKWITIGIQLGIDYHVLKGFGQQYNNDPIRCLTELLQYWLDGNAANGKSHVNWETIIKALKSPSVNESGLAEKICENHQLQQAVHASECDSQSISTPGNDNPVEDTPESNECVTSTPGACAGPVSVQCSMQSQEPEFSCLVHKLRGLSVDHRTELQSRLFYESNEIIKKFNRFFISVRESLDKRQVSIKHVTEVLLGLGTFKSVSRHTKTSAFEEDFESLKEAKSVIDIMEIVRLYCNFFSYDIIEELVRALGNEEDKGNLSQYIEEFNNYAKRKVYECPTELSPVTDSGQAIIYVTLDESYDDCTLSHLRLLHGKLCQILQIPSKGVLRLCRVEPGSIKLVFSLPERLLKDIFPLSYGKKILLLSFKVTKLSHCSHHYSRLYSEFNSQDLLPTLKPNTGMQGAQHVKIHENIDDSTSVCTTDSGYASIDSSSSVSQVGDVAQRAPGLINSKGQRGTAKYKCRKCGDKWKMKNSRGSPKTCEGCGQKGIQPYDFIHCIVPQPKRMFGEFHCSCGRQWSSGYTWIEWDEAAEKWVENWQQCRDCKKEVYPTAVRPLRYIGGITAQKPHDSKACAMCRKYGDCRSLGKSRVGEGKWDDSVSVRSEASSISDVSEDCNLSDRTPVNSDEETVDDLLSSQLKGLNMK